MSKLLLGFAVLGFAMMTTSVAHAQNGVAKKQDGKGTIRQKPDLSVTSLYTADNLVLVNVVNRGGHQAWKTTRMRVRMFRTVDGREQLVATAFAYIPPMNPGAHNRITVTFPSSVLGSRLVGELDYLDEISEVNERDNRFERVVR